MAGRRTQSDARERWRRNGVHLWMYWESVTQNLVPALSRRHHAVWPLIKDGAVTHSVGVAKLCFSPVGASA